MVLGFSYGDQNLYAQNLKCTVYDNENGLSSNLIKAVVQDSVGYIWIASDAGLSRFDGKNFITYASQFPSLFIKDVKVHHGKLIVTTDLGVGFFLNNNKKYEFQNFAPGLSYDTDTSLLYPKSVFMDSKGNIWISEQYSISRATEKGIKKYRFEKRNYSDSYSRSFQFVEDNTGNLFAFSWTGYIYKFDPQSDKFRELEFKPSFDHFSINEVQVRPDNSLWCGTSNGLFRFEIDDKQKVTYSTIVSGQAISSFKFNKAGDIYVGTWFNGCYLLNSKTGLLRHIDKLPFRSVNNLFVDKEGSVWVCSDDGLAILEETFFTKAIYNNPRIETNTAYIINVISDNGSIYFSDQEYVYKINGNADNYTYEKILDSKNQRIYCFDVSQEKIWVSYRTGELDYYPRAGVKRDFTGFIKGRINAVRIVGDEEIWGFDESSKEFVNIQNEKQVTYYSPGQLKPEYIRVIKANNNGDIFFAGNGKGSFFYSFNSEKKKIENLSDLFTIRPGQQITIFDMFIQGKESVLLASSLGLFEFKNNRIKQVNISDQNFITKAINSDGRGRLWLGSEKGLVLLEGDQYTSYFKQDGLPNSTISERSIAFDKNQRLWVGTASGIAYWQNISQAAGSTPGPFISKILISGKEKVSSELEELTGNIDFEADFVSLSYPDRIQYQTRLLGFDDRWSESVTHNSIRFTNLPPGNYTLQIRARQSGSFWSPVTEITFNVVPPWYKTWWMYVLYSILFIISISFLTFAINKNRIEKLSRREKELEFLVSEKTKDLQEEKETTLKLLKETEKAKKEIERVNEDLRNANQFKSDLLSIAAHDLKNPLSSIIGFSRMIRDENHSPQISQMVNIIYESSLRMLNLIADILESVSIESSKLNLKIETIAFSELCRKTAENNLPRAKMKNQELVCNIEDDITIDADEKWIREALDNILSNAIKYSPKHKPIHIDLIKSGDCARFSVKDQGPGLTEHDKKNLFKKFTRLSAQPTGGESSTGLGLSIVKEIVDLHHGKIWAESEQGSGATFIIELNINQK